MRGTFSLGQEIVRAKKVTKTFEVGVLRLVFPNLLLYKPFSSVRPLSAFFHLLRNTFSHCLTLGEQLLFRIHTLLLSRGCPYHKVKNFTCQNHKSRAWSSILD
ncbi:hypothetical protein G4B88_024964 [Cannabis sativa]|uniref:Uncharacterized protein n=1 Tax=Cannabis sativa TaxID=3483 RepID=A0A7J6EBV3_CANSA|nr:hypothetical protein G4B88_024964 [Cannabis sativa]